MIGIHLECEFHDCPTEDLWAPLGFAWEQLQRYHLRGSLV